MNTKTKRPTKNIKQHVGIDSAFNKPDGTQMSHDEIYTKIVNDIGLNRCIHYIPATLEEIQEALKTDEHLNNIPLAKWDNMHSVFTQAFTSIGINMLSLSDTICTLKQAARMWVERESTKKEQIA